MSNCKNPIFIVGAPRSGTTLLRSILDANPNICCPVWETGIFDRFGPIIHGDYSLVANGIVVDSSLPPRDEIVAWIRRCVDDLMELLTVQCGKPRWGEKTPSHVFEIGLIREVYPDAQFLHIVRDGHDVVRSLQNVRWSPKRIRWSVNRWKASVQAGRDAGKSLSPDQYFELRYEDLIHETPAVLERICKFLREPFLPQMLEFYKPENNSWSRPGEKIHVKQGDRYRRLSIGERLILFWKAGRLLRELGYR